MHGGPALLLKRHLAPIMSPYLSHSRLLLDITTTARHARSINKERSLVATVAADVQPCHYSHTHCLLLEIVRASSIVHDTKMTTTLRLNLHQ